MQYSNVAEKQKSNGIYRYPAELTSGKVRRLKFEAVITNTDTEITIGFLPSGTTSILGISRMSASVTTPVAIVIPAHKSMGGEDVVETTICDVSGANTASGAPMTSTCTGVDIDSQTQVPVILKLSTPVTPGATFNGELYFTYE